MGEVSTILSSEEQAELKGHEEVIQDNLFSFVEVGTRLLCIRDKRLWRGHESFDAYLKFRWPTIASFSSRYRRDLAAAAEVVTDIQDYISANENPESGTIVPLSGIANTLDLEIPLPQNEYQARSMAPIPREARGPVWKDLVQQSGGKAPTGDKIKNAVDEFMGSPGPDVAPIAPELREPELLPSSDEYEPSRSRTNLDRFTSSYRVVNKDTPSYKLSQCLLGLKAIAAWSYQALQDGTHETYKMALEQIGEEANEKMESAS